MREAFWQACLADDPCIAASSTVDGVYKMDILKAALAAL